MVGYLPQLMGKMGQLLSDLISLVLVSVSAFALKSWGFVSGVVGERDCGIYKAPFVTSFTGRCL